MNRYLEYTIEGLVDEDAREMLLALLDAAGYSGFVEESDRLIAYIHQESQDESALRQMLETATAKAPVFSCNVLPEKNWNEEWERSFSPVTIDKCVVIRASFHPEPDEIQHDIQVDPKMSFGTGHHATTRLMIRAMLDLNLKARTVADLGSGTGVLAILARKLGASHVLAVDTDEWAVRNAAENITLNGMEQIEVLQGTITSLGTRSFDMLLANINTNTLLSEMQAYSAALNPGGILVISGFLQQDHDDLLREALACDLESVKVFSDQPWMAGVYIKQK